MIINSIADLRELARRRVPRAIFDYADRGSYDEVTFNRNLADLHAIELRQRVMVDVSKQQLATNILGEDWTIPLGIGPTGLTGLFHANGEMLGARAAQAFGVPFCLSTMSICSIEDVRGAVQKPFWFQLYLMRDRSFNVELLERANAANCSAIMLTVDMPVQGLRRRDPKNGLSIPPKLTLKNIFEVVMRPAWAAKVLTGRRRTFGNLEARMKGTGGLKTLSEWIAQQFDPTVTWKDLAWLRDHWPRKIIIKGILDAEDARLACEHGVDAMVVSNHGGRQLDGARSTISALPEVVDAVAGRCEILFDGGVRTGQDVLKALALGAKGCLMGKAFLYALAARGEAGVTLALDIIRRELAVSLALTGANDVRNVTPEILVRRRQAG
ncbi:MAG TPA: alpha-hydroxy acid oxidase [Steroidobacteraceae bacterium]|nr:alpha-hydroxy acid oxidase [Steroidobacteraceae bacterium]